MEETFEIVWLDINASDPHSSFRHKIGQNAEIFTDTQHCLEFIQSHPTQAIYLIVSGHFAKEIIPLIFNLPQLVKFYVFCGSMINYVAWSLDYLEKVLVFEHGDDLLQRLWNDLARSYRAKGDGYQAQVKEFEERAAQYRKPCG